MKPVQKFVVTANLPERLAKLKELAYNYWWCWNPDVKELFNRIDRKVWEDVHHNPVLLINKMTQDRLRELSEQPDFVSFLNYVYDKFRNYIESTAWYDDVKGEAEGRIAYFSPEFGINESFPNYSGGLGILSGDHLKSASDLGLPMVGVGLLYQMGYFRQHLTQSGWQNEIYKFNDFYSLPIFLEKDEHGSPLKIEVDLPLTKAYAQIWRLQLGKVPLYLLDTNIEANEVEEYRDITDQLYGGTRETRIQQEILLGIGGMRALEALGIDPHCIHINEGHAAFALLERTYMFTQRYGVNFKDAKELTRSSSLFTTHTPVPAGNEVFRYDRMENYFQNYYKKLGLGREEFYELGQETDFNPDNKFSMTILGIKLTAFRNGVSELHGEVAQKMWHRIWQCFPPDEVPIGHITNGVHPLTWVAREFGELYDRYLSPSWRVDSDNQDIWKNVDAIPSEELYREKQRRRVRLVLYARDYLKNRQKDFLPPDQISKINEYLDTEALTIGFARRFATYKRALLVFSDMERLKAILTNPEKPVQIIIAGKAHPHDTAGKEVIQSIIHKVRQHGLERHVVFLEDYDMVIGRLMVKGCDIWLNTPIRPMEASGTSGMKAAMNGTLNLSILDGWWDEAYDGTNGFAIGEGQNEEDTDEKRIIESQLIYELLEQTIVPLFYDRSKTLVPHGWVEYMKNCIKSIAPYFSTNRMVKEYTEKYYLNALERYQLLSENNAENAGKLKKWKEKVRKAWEKVEIIDASLIENGEAFVGKPIQVSAVVSLGKLKPEDVMVQVYYGSLDPHGDFLESNTEKLELVRSEGEYHHYEGAYVCPDAGMQGFTIRILPVHELIVAPAELYLCRWANE